MEEKEYYGDNILFKPIYICHDYGNNQMLNYIRITSYLVKRSEVEKLENDEVALRDAVVFGQGNNKMANVIKSKNDNTVC